MDERSVIATMHRRAGFGLTGADLDAAAARGVTAEIGRLVEPASAGLAAPADPWDGLDLSYAQGTVRLKGMDMIDRWLSRMVDSARPAHERMAWFWHGHLTSSLSKVKVPAAMATQIRLFWQLGLGRFDALLRAVTTDAGMLVYLDGTESTGAAPNENYGRELMELFALGRTAGYTEADVQAAARALTGWRVGAKRLDPTATFDPKRHDDKPQTLLGLAGVHDVDTVMKAVTGHPACAPYITSRLARSIIGPNVEPALVATLGDRFRASGLDIADLLRGLLEALAAGHDGGPVVMAPVPWLVMAERLTGVRLEAKVRVAGLQAAGQMPLNPPNVAGWPSGEAWYTSATVVARFDLASAIATALAPDAPALVAATDPVQLAHVLGLPGAFSPATVSQLVAVREPAARVVIALTSPELVLG